MNLYSYVVARDYGFAPNPFHGQCTLATCKPAIRKYAKIGDWVVGTGSVTLKRQDYLVFAMQVDDIRTFDGYWSDANFTAKKPSMLGSLKQAFGDNIYCHSNGHSWNQLNSHHSRSDGSPNKHNIRNDTQTDRVLIGSRFRYWGGTGPKIPQRFRDYDNYDICAGRGYKRKFPPGLVAEFTQWINSLGEGGFLGEPLEWSRRR